MTTIRNQDLTRPKIKQHIEEARSFFLVFQLPLSLIQSILTLSLLIRSNSSPQTRIHHFYLWITICLAAALAWITALLSIFVFKTLHKMNIPSRASTWLIRILYASGLGWLILAIVLATTPRSCQNISYCAHHRAVIAFSFIMCILSLFSANGHHSDVRAIPYNQPYIPDGNQASKSKAPLANPPMDKKDESQNSVEPMDGPAEEECSEKRMDKEFVDLERG